jgi:hypothetical protein
MTCRCILVRNGALQEVMLWANMAPVRYAGRTCEVMQQICVACLASLDFGLLTTTTKKGSLLGVKLEKGYHTHRPPCFLATCQWQECYRTPTSH